MLYFLFDRIFLNLFICFFFFFGRFHFWHDSKIFNLHDWNRWCLGRTVYLIWSIPLPQCVYTVCWVKGKEIDIKAIDGRDFHSPIVAHRDGDTKFPSSINSFCGQHLSKWYKLNPLCREMLPGNSSSSLETGLGAVKWASQKKKKKENK